jgi:hypothetical protein
MVHCLRCGETYRYDPNTSHVCDAPARAIETTTRGDNLAKRLATLEFEARSRLNALERRIRELETAPARQATASVASIDAPAPPHKGRDGKPPFDRRAYHARYMRDWRRRQTAAKTLGKEGEG